MSVPPASRSSLSRYALAVALSVGFVTLRGAVQPMLGAVLPFHLLIAAVLASAWWGGLGPGLVATALCAIAGQALFAPAAGMFHFAGLREVLRFISFIILGSSISIMAEALQRAIRGEWSQKEALRISEERLRLAVKATEDAVWDWNVAAGNLGWSPAVAARFGWPETSQETDTRWWQERVHEDDRPRVFASLQAAVADPLCDHWEEQYRFRRGDGSFAYVIDRGSVLRDQERKAVRMIGAMLDLTSRKRAEAAIFEVSEQRRLALEAADLGTWDWDLATGKRVGSDRMFDLIGVPLDDLRNAESFYDAVHPDDVEPLREAMKATLSDPSHGLETQYRVIHPDGSIHWLLAKGAVYSDEETGQPLRLTGILMDITERMANSHRLTAALDSAEAANRAKDAFLAALSHELRTPLTPVLFLAAAMERSPELTSTLRRDFAMIRKNIELEARLIDDLLDLTRITRGKLALQREPVDAHSVLEQSWALLRDDAEAKQLAVEFLLEAVECQLHADAVRMQQVFWNVLKNAVKFTPAGGRISIRSRNLPPGLLHLAVSDSGIGISADELPQIFDAFAQGKEASSHRFGGLGLGLAISAHLVQEHGGRIHAESDGHGKGATFHLELPLGSIAAPESEELRPLEADSTSAPRHLLLVEDHEPTRHTLIRLLGRRGYLVSVAEDAAQARTLARGARFDLMVSDLGLPDGSGYELAVEFRREHGLNAIALTGFGMEEDVQRSLDAGFLEHITKPIDIHALYHAIERATASNSAVAQGAPVLNPNAG